jgi:hypothetical protein
LRRVASVPRKDIYAFDWKPKALGGAGAFLIIFALGCMLTGLGFMPPFFFLGISCLPSFLWVHEIEVDHDTDTYEIRKGFRPFLKIKYGKASDLKVFRRTLRDHCLALYDGGQLLEKLHQGSLLKAFFAKTGLPRSILQKQNIKVWCYAPFWSRRGYQFGRLYFLAIFMRDARPGPHEIQILQWIANPHLIHPVITLVKIASLIDLIRLPIRCEVEIEQGSGLYTFKRGFAFWTRTTTGQSEDLRVKYLRSRLLAAYLFDKDRPILCLSYRFRRRAERQPLILLAQNLGLPDSAVEV